MLLFFLGSFPHGWEPLPGVSTSSIFWASDNTTCLNKISSLTAVLKCTREDPTPKRWSKMQACVNSARLSARAWFSRIGTV